MVLKVLGSSSSGNCYLLESDTECLVIEAGLPYMEVKKALDFNVSKIVGVVVSHSHGDHAKYHGEYVKASIPVYKPYDETKACPLKISYGGFSIRSFRLCHDVPCYGFYIQHPDIGSLIYASDTEYIKYRFKGLNHILVEANYDMQFVDKNQPNYEHVLQGHMSIQTASQFIQTNDNPNLRTVCLIHLSEKNADSSAFQEQIQKITAANVYVAKPKLNIELSLPF